MTPINPKAAVGDPVPTSDVLTRRHRLDLAWNAKLAPLLSEKNRRYWSCVVQPLRSISVSISR